MGLFSRRRPTASDLDDLGDLAPVLTKPEITKLTAKDFSLSAYADLCAAIGVDCPEVASEKLIRTLLSLSLPIYDYEQVGSYMDKMAAADPRKYAVAWHWAPLREVDFAAPRFVPLVDRNNDSGTNYHRTGRHNKWVSRPVYRHTVPMRVLEQVKAIIAKHSEPLHFFATDYHTPNPDPFMAVTDKFCSKLFVFAVWDEPGFDEKYATI